MVGHHDAEIGHLERPPVGRRRDPRDVDDDIVELLAQRRDERLDRNGGEMQIFAQRLFRAKHEQPLADRRHYPLEQRVVDAQRIAERLAQPGVRLDVEHQRAIAVLQVEVDERNPAALPVGEVPGRVDRQRRRADAAARPDEGDQGSELSMDQARIAGMGPAARQRLGQQLRVERLDDIVGNPGMQQITIEADFVAVADRDHRDAGLADIGELVDL